MYMCMYIHIYIYIHTYIRTYVYIGVYLCVMLLFICSAIPSSRYDMTYYDNNNTNDATPIIACYIITCTHGRLLDDRVSTTYYICMLRTHDSGHIGSSLGLPNGRVNRRNPLSDSSQ